MQNKKSKSRRNFLKKSGLIGTGVFIVPRHVLGGVGYTAPSDQLALAAVGSGGKGRSDIANAYQGGKNKVIALCDVDPSEASSSYNTHPNANKYIDYREMLDKEKDIDALTISTPDHNHAKVAYDCMTMGIHVYVQKPLTHTIAEARLLSKTAEKYKIVTQMGNQGGSSIGVPKIKEWINKGKVGKVHTIYAWTNRPVWPQGIDHPSANKSKKPSTLNWDLWLGTAKSKPYSPGLHPFDWRGFWEYGTGALGDIGCHILDAPYKALQLGYPSSVECSATNVFKKMWVPEYTPEGCPISSMVTLDYKNSPHNKDGIKLIWMDGGLTPTIPEQVKEEFIMNFDAGNSSGIMMIGNKGVITSEIYANNPTLYLKGEDPVVFSTRNQPNVNNVHASTWTEACKAGFDSRQHKELTSSFDYSGPFTETVIMGNLALRSRDLRNIVSTNSNGRQKLDYYGRKKLLWDGENMKITNLDEANSYVSKTYRKGWELPI
jgi:predicted dehydrogenase